MKSKKQQVFEGVLLSKTAEELEALHRHGPEEEDLEITGLSSDTWKACVRWAFRAKMQAA